MGRTQYGIVAKRLKRDIDKVISEKAFRFGEDISETISSEFLRIAQTKLENYGRMYAKDSISSEKIQELSESMYLDDDVKLKLSSGSGSKLSKSTKIGTIVRIPIDKDKLMMYLEFGTGLVGQNYPHPEAGRFGWNYAINDNTVRYSQTRYRKFSNFWYPTIETDYGPKRGFVFKYKNQYLDKSDRIFRNQYTKVITIYDKLIIVPEHDRHTKNGKLYHQKQYSYLRRVRNPISTHVDYYGKREYVVSAGIRPARFLYETKTAVRNVLKEFKGLSFASKNVRAKLEKSLASIQF